VDYTDKIIGQIVNFEMRFQERPPGPAAGLANSRRALLWMPTSCWPSGRRASATGFRADLPALSSLSQVQSNGLAFFRKPQ